MDRSNVETTAGSLGFTSPKRLSGENKSKVIFVVDDDTETIALVASIGRKAGYTVLSAPSGEACLAMLWRLKPQLIMLDVKMAGLDGFETCRRVRNEPNVARVPIAFLTARKTLDDVKRGVAVGGDDFIVKPFDPAELVGRIEFLVSRGPLLNLDRARRSSKFGPIEQAAAELAEANDEEDEEIEMIPASTDLESRQTSAKQTAPASLQEIAALPLAPFLAREGHHSAPGLISMLILPYWWRALLAIAPDQLAATQRDLDRLSPVHDVAGRETLSLTLRGVVATLTDRLAEMVVDIKPSSPTAVKALARVASADDMKLIAEILSVAGPLGEAIGSFNTGAMDDANSRPIAELSPSLVTETTKYYTKLGEGGIAGRLFVVAILNRLEKPWQIFRVPRSLSLNREASVVSGTELAVIGDRLLSDLGEFANAVDAATREIGATASPIDYAGLQALVARYIDGDEGLRQEINIRRDSNWGAALMQTRARMRVALDEDRLQKLGEAILSPLSALSDGELPSLASLHDDGETPQTISDAGRAIRFLNHVATRGAAHGFGAAAERLLGGVRATAALQIESMTDLVVGAPIDQATRARLERALQLVRLLFDEHRKKVLGNRLGAILTGH
jgi:DNA-binding response OmpR family regulator